jgi:hypothetical protein
MHVGTLSKHSNHTKGFFELVLIFKGHLAYLVREG